MSRRLVIQRTGAVLCEDVTWADSRRARSRGLLGRTEMAETEGLLLEPCRQVHTFGMAFPVDVVFLDRSWTVLSIARDLKPNRMTKVHIRSRRALEIPAGRSDGLRAGDVLVAE